MAGGALPLAHGGAMVRYPRYLSATLCAVVMSASALVHVQDRAVAGPPPGERAAIDAVVNGLSGTADGWKAIAKARFAPQPALESWKRSD